MRATYLAGIAGLIAFGVTSADAAMCGRSCNNGGRYIPGPPGVCAANGLNYCGSSRGGGGGGVVVQPVPGVQVVVPGAGGPPRGGCRTTTVRRPDGTVITRRDC